jgi:hypothetical protein
MARAALPLPAQRPVPTGSAADWVAPELNNGAYMKLPAVRETLMADAREAGQLEIFNRGSYWLW